MDGEWLTKQSFFMEIKSSLSPTLEFFSESFLLFIKKKNTVICKINTNGLKKGSRRCFKKVLSWKKALSRLECPPENNEKLIESYQFSDVFRGKRGAQNWFEFNTVNKKEETYEKIHQQVNNLNMLKSVRFDTELCLVSSECLVCHPTC